MYIGNRVFVKLQLWFAEILGEKNVPHIPQDNPIPYGGSPRIAAWFD